MGRSIPVHFVLRVQNEEVYDGTFSIVSSAYPRLLLIEVGLRYGYPRRIGWILPWFSFMARIPLMPNIAPMRFLHFGQNTSSPIGAWGCMPTLS